MIYTHEHDECINQAKLNATNIQTPKSSSSNVVINKNDIRTKDTMPPFHTVIALVPLNCVLYGQLQLWCKGEQNKSISVIVKLQPNTDLVPRELCIPTDSVKEYKNIFWFRHHPFPKLILALLSWIITKIQFYVYVTWKSYFGWFYNWYYWLLY